MSKYTIKLKKYLDIVLEIASGGVITPGMLVKLGSGNTVTAHSTAGGNAAPVMFACEDELQGKGIEDNYAFGDKVQVWIPQRGEEVYAILADGQNVAIGDLLESAGNGYLQKHTADTVDESWESADTQSANSIDLTVYPNQIVAMALEAKDLSDSSGAEESSDPIGFNKRIMVMVI